MIHVVVIDLRSSKSQFIVTPPDNSGGAPLNARTTSQFLQERELQIAINGDGFYHGGRAALWISIRTLATLSHSVDILPRAVKSMCAAMRWILHKNRHSI